MEIIDFEKIRKKEKISISISLDKENVDWLKSDIEKHGKNIPLSSVFNMLLENFIKLRTSQKDGIKSNEVSK